MEKTSEEITLSLTAEEIIMLQELTEDTECAYEWLVKIAESLRAKAMAAYQKPRISREDYVEILQDTQERFSKYDEELASAMVMAKRVELEYRYEVEE